MIGCARAHPDPCYTAAMAVHTIEMPDRLRGRELHTIFWNDEAGTVTGTHSAVPWLAEMLANRPVILPMHQHHPWILHDPSHEPGEFVALLAHAYWPILDPNRDLHRLPSALRDAPRPPLPPLRKAYEILPDGTRGRELIPGQDFVY